MIIVFDVEQAEADLTAGAAGLPALRRAVAAVVVGGRAAGTRPRWDVPVGTPAAGPLHLVPRQPGAATGLVPAAAG